jgi:hypothetical protein
MADDTVLRLATPPPEIRQPVFPGSEEGLPAEEYTGTYLLSPRPGQVLDRQGDLRERLAHPTLPMTEYVMGFARTLADSGHAGVVKDTGRDRQAMMFYPYNTVATDPRTARTWMVDTAKDLFRARTFQVTAEMVKVVKEISTATAAGLEAIESPELPSEAGFVWLDSPLIYNDANGRAVSTRAISWGTVPVSFQDDQGRVRRSMGVRIILWTLDGDPSWYKVPRESLVTMGDMQFDHIMVIPFGERFNAGTVVDKRGDIVIDAQSSLHYVHVLWQLMEQEVFVTHEKPAVDKPARKRAQRSLQQGEVTVVTLRRAKHIEADFDHEARHIDWSCRWLVQGHWRHIGRYEGPRHHAVNDKYSYEPQCATCGGRLTWVKAYIKGPDEMPLKATEKLYRLSR